MARKPNPIPSYLLHKASGQARCRIDGRDILLGPFGSEESRIRYGELIANMAGGIPVDPFAYSNRGKVPRNDSAEAGPTVGELCLIFLKHAETYYVKNGKQTSQVHVFKSVVKVLNSLYGLTPATKFGPLALQAVRAKMVSLGWTRGVVNLSVLRIRQIFRHATSQELIPPDILTALKSVPALAEGRTEAPDLPPREAVDDARIKSVRKLVSPLVRDLIDLQTLTGARSGEMLSLTTGMINRAGKVWSAELQDHKTRHKGKSRVLYFGPKAQRLLRYYLSDSPNEKLFNITRCAYCRAITRACDAAKVERWVPHQLRHTAATKVRDQFGLEHAQAILGHSKADMTQRYAMLTQQKAVDVASKVG